MLVSEGERMTRPKQLRIFVRIAIAVLVLGFAVLFLAAIIMSRRYDTSEHDDSASCPQYPRAVLCQV